MTQRARHLAVREQVLERLGPVEAERPHPVPVPPAPHRDRASERCRVEDGEVRPLGWPARRCSISARTSQAPKRQTPGTVRLPSAGSSPGAGGEPDVPVLGVRLDPAAELDHPALGLLAEPPDLRRPRPPEGHLHAGRPLRQQPEHQTADRRIHLRQRVAPDRSRRLGPGCRQRLSREPVERLRPPRRAPPGSRRSSPPPPSRSRAGRGAPRCGPGCARRRARRWWVVGERQARPPRRAGAPGPARARGSAG